MMYEDAFCKVPNPECVNCDMTHNCLAPHCRLWQQKHNHIQDDITLEESIFSLEAELMSQQTQQQHKNVNQGADTLPQWLRNRQDAEALEARQAERNELLQSREYLKSSL